MIRRNIALLTGAMILVLAQFATASPPAVGIVGNSRNCLACHSSNGSWAEGSNLIIDLVDKKTQQSLRQPDGSFLLTSRRGEATTVIAVIGYRASTPEETPYRNGWILVDTATIGASSLSKFSPGWEVNLPYGCRLVGDKIDKYPDAALTTASITVLPTATANDGDVTLQIMLMKGEPVKGNARLGLVGNYHERTVHLRVTDVK